MDATMPRDYYEILGVPRSASKDDIKRAFRQLARQYHPDVSSDSNAEERFKEINEAYQVLSDDQKRAAYDRYGHAGVNGAPGAGFSGGFPGFEEIFEEFFGGLGGFGFGGGGRRRRGPVAGRDLRVDLQIDFQQAVFGAEIPVDLNRREACSVCHGSGAEPGTSARTCPECNGTGQVKRMQQSFGFNMVNVMDCPRCNGRGQIVDHPCHECRGQGIVNATRKLNVKIPPGVDDGMQIRLSSEGEPSPNGGPTGDLYVVLHVTPHEFFKRRDNDIILEVGINVAQAALGDIITVPTLEGEAEISIPAGTQFGKVIRMRDKGVPKLRRDGTTSGRGDQLVVITIDIPNKLTKEQRELFEQLSESLGRDVIPQKSARSLRDRLNEFLGGN